MLFIAVNRAFPLRLRRQEFSFTNVAFLTTIYRIVPLIIN
jgi:hypothetical protein